MYYIKKDMSATQCVPEVSVSAFHVWIIMPIILLPETGKVKHRDITCLKTQAKSTGWTLYLINLLSMLCPQNQNKTFLLNNFLKNL